jgi:hypothetical protein
MTKAAAEALIAGQKIQYWDGRIATVTSPASESTVGEIFIVFDAEPDPKPVYHIKSEDFTRAEPI